MQYFRIYWQLIKINFAEHLAYRAHFINNVISTVCWAIFQIVWISLLTYKNQSAFGWRKEELIILTITFVIISGIQHCFISKNFGEMSRVIDHGLLDSFLLKPVDSQFLLSLTIVNFAGLFRFFFGVVALIVALNRFNIHPSFLNVISYISLMVFGLMSIYSIWYILSTIIIWFPQLDNLVDFLYDLTGISRYPKEMILKTNNYFLFFLLPITIIGATPTRFLFNKILAGDVLLLLVSSIGLFFISRRFWKFALHFYTSAS